MSRKDTVLIHIASEPRQWGVASLAEDLGTYRSKVRRDVYELVSDGLVEPGEPLSPTKKGAASCAR